MEDGNTAAEIDMDKWWKSNEVSQAYSEQRFYDLVNFDEGIIIDVITDILADDNTVFQLIKSALLMSTDNGIRKAEKQASEMLFAVLRERLHRIANED